MRPKRETEIVRKYANIRERFIFVLIFFETMDSISEGPQSE